jgi:ABC-type multidrug transport system ATPase subunit
VLEISGLQHAKEKALKVFSSGMKQRLKLTLAIMADCPTLMLDEPCSNLDTKAIDWYHKMLDKFAKDKLIIICSNHLQYEYQICNEQINTEVFK